MIACWNCAWIVKDMLTAIARKRCFDYMVWVLSLNWQHSLEARHKCTHQSEHKSDRTRPWRESFCASFKADRAIKLSSSFPGERQRCVGQFPYVPFLIGRVFKPKKRWFLGDTCVMQNPSESSIFPRLMSLRVPNRPTESSNHFLRAIWFIETSFNNIVPWYSFWIRRYMYHGTQS